LIHLSPKGLNRVEIKLFRINKNKANIKINNKIAMFILAQGKFLKIIIITQDLYILILFLLRKII